MKKYRWQIILGIFLAGMSAALYGLSVLFFKSPRDTFFYLLQDLAFVPMQVLFVTVIIDRLLSRREKAAMIRKLNMVIGVFFSETGNGLIRMFAGFEDQFDRFRPILGLSIAWGENEFNRAGKELEKLEWKVGAGKGDLNALKEYLVNRRSFLLGLMENQNLLEHESFTEMLLAVFHLMEELSFRENLSGLSKQDQEHLSIDILRAYRLLVTEWLSYLRHLRSQYPYLYSMAVRVNPFDPHAKAEIQ